MGLIIWILFGALAGWIASLITSTAHGLIGDIIMGIIGAVVGGWIMGLFGQSGVSGFNLYSLLVAVVGACVVIFIGRAIRRV